MAWGRRHRGAVRQHYWWHAADTRTLAGQGLNLTMREADMLAGLWLMQSNGEPIGELDSLATYLKQPPSSFW